MRWKINTSNSTEPSNINDHDISNNSKQPQIFLSARPRTSILAPRVRVWNNKVLATSLQSRVPRWFKSNANMTISLKRAIHACAGGEPTVKMCSRSETWIARDSDGVLRLLPLSADEPPTASPRWENGSFDPAGPEFFRFREMRPCGMLYAGRAVTFEWRWAVLLAKRIESNVDQVVIFIHRRYANGEIGLPYRLPNLFSNEVNYWGYGTSELHKDGAC